MDAADGKTVKLVSDVDISAVGLIVSKSVTLDLNGCEIKAANTSAGNINVSGHLTLCDNGDGTGVITTETDYKDSNTGHAIIDVAGSFVMESGTINAVRPDASQNGQFGVMLSGIGASVTINGGTIEAGWYPISGNNRSTWNSSIVVNGGELISTADYAIYHPIEGGMVTINGGTVYGEAGGIALNAGELLVKGGTVTSKGQGSTGNWGDGTGKLENAAVNISANYDQVTVAIIGGILSAEGDAIAIATGTKHPVNLSIRGGTFKGTLDKLEAYLDPGYILDESGEVMVDPNAASVAQIGGEKFPSIQAAVKAAKTGETVTVLTDTKENFDVPAGRDVVLDLAGFTVTTDKTILVEGKLTIVDSTADAAPVVSDDYKTITYRSGKIVNESVTVAVRNGGEVVLNSGTLISEKNYTIAVYGNNSAANWDTPIHSSATINGGYQQGLEGGPGVMGNGAELNVHGGVIEGLDNSAVAGNGSKDQNTNNGGTVIHITGGTLIGRIKTPGYIASGIYHPQAGELNISGGTIYADGGVGILNRGGDLNITGGTIIASGDAEGWVGDNKNMVPSSGIVLDTAAGYYNAAQSDIKISGNVSVQADFGQEVVHHIKASGDADQLIVSGGNFSAPVNSDYLDNTLNAQLYSTNRSPDAPYSYYHTVQEALDSAQPGDNIVDLNNPPDENTPKFTLTLKPGNGEADVVYTGQAAKSMIRLPEPSRSGYRFGGWYDENGTAVGDFYTITDSDATLTARWSRQSSGGSNDDTYYYTIWVTCGRNGSITPEQNTHVAEGRSRTFTITPDKGYEVADVLVDGESVGAVERYTFQNVQKSHTIKVSFQPEGAVSAESSSTGTETAGKTNPDTGR